MASSGTLRTPWYCVVQEVAAEAEKAWGARGAAPDTVPPSFTEIS